VAARLRDSGVVVLSVAALCGCNNLPEAYAPPPQRPFFEAPHPVVRTILNMADVDVESDFVQDISPTLEASTWRWTGKRPTVSVRVGSGQKLKYVMDFAIPGAAFQQTGPVTLSLFVDHLLLGRASYAAPGRYRIEKPVPEGWVPANQEVTVAAEIDKIYKPAPGAKPLGFILVAIGFETQ
jgi:hypothetical protein